MRSDTLQGQFVTRFDSAQPHHAHVFANRRATVVCRGATVRPKLVTRAPPIASAGGGSPMRLPLDHLSIAGSLKGQDLICGRARRYTTKNERSFFCAALRLCRMARCLY